jgi:hypothetical protein
VIVGSYTCALASPATTAMFLASHDDNHDVATKHDCG